ncbi:OSTA protein, partial [Polyodon spathula]|nr:OSTA protein [Polyodon spathula]
MIVEEYGGEDAFIHRLHGVPMKISTGPCCCCCDCLPTIPMARKTLTVLNSGTLQAALLRPILLFFATVLWTNGNYEQGKSVLILAQAQVMNQQRLVMEMFILILVSRCYYRQQYHLNIEEGCPSQCQEQDKLKSHANGGVVLLTKPLMVSQQNVQLM